MKELGDEAAGLRKEVAVLTEDLALAARGATTDGKDAAECRRRVAEMQAEALAEAAALIAEANAEAEAEQQKPTKN